MVNIKSKPKKMSLRTKILSLLQRRGEMRACLIKEFLIYGDVSGALSRLLDEKMVERVSKGVYKITDKGEHEVDKECEPKEV